jgi:hypothetical protein
VDRPFISVWFEGLHRFGLLPEQIVNERLLAVLECLPVRQEFLDSVALFFFRHGECSIFSAQWLLKQAPFLPYHPSGCAVAVDGSAYVNLTPLRALPQGRFGLSLAAQFTRLRLTMVSGLGEIVRVSALYDKQPPGNFAAVFKAQAN